jgi:hypothetical protein
MASPRESRGSWCAELELLAGFRGVLLLARGSRFEVYRVLVFGHLSRSFLYLVFASIPPWENVLPSKTAIPNAKTENLGIFLNKTKPDLGIGLCFVNLQLQFSRVLVFHLSPKSNGVELTLFGS